MLSTSVKKLECEIEKLRAENEQLKRYCVNQELKPKACGLCKHFYKHYVLADGRFLEIADGHCSKGHKKMRKWEDVCPHFEP